MQSSGKRKGLHSKPIVPASNTQAMDRIESILHVLDVTNTETVEAGIREQRDESED